MSGVLSSLLFALPILANAEEGQILWSVDWNKTGSHFAVGGVNTIWLYEAKTFKRTSLFPETNEAQRTEDTGVTAVSWHPSRNLLAVSSQGGNVNGIYDVESHKRVPLDVDHGRGIDWNPTGDALAISSTGDGHLRIWKSDGSLLHDVPRYKKALSLTGVAWHPSGDRLVTIGKYITLHAADGRVIKQIQHRPGSEGDCLLLCVEWHPSGEFFVVGDYGNMDTADPPAIQFWSADGVLKKAIPINGGAEFRSISWNRDGTLLASASDKLRVWTETGELVHEGDSPDLLWGVDWHPDGDKILTSSAEGRVTIWTSKATVSRKVVAAEESAKRTTSD